MAFWGVYLKPNEPYTLHYHDDAVPKRLRITQATLGDATRHSPARSIVRCSVGDKPAIAICSLSVRELICCQLELEFEEAHDVVFSVMGPRGVYLAGYLITPAPTACRFSDDHKGQEKATVETAGCSDHDLHEAELDSIKTCLIKESLNTDIEQSDKHINSGKRMLKCVKDKNREGKIIITIDRKIGKDGNENSGINEAQDETIGVKTHSVCGKVLEDNRDAIERKKKKKNKKCKKRKVSTLEATATEDVNDLSDENFDSASRITEENGILRANNSEIFNSSDACERNDAKVKERKKNKKKKRKHTLDYDKNHSIGDMNGNSNIFKSRRPTTGNVEKVKSREQERKKGEIVLTKKAVF